MNPICVRLDLDSTPWVATSGFGIEQARLVTMFEFARRTGVKFHVFASSRCLRASPGVVDAVLGDGHDLDWLYTGDQAGVAQAWEEAGKEIRGTGHRWWGIGVLTGWSAPFPDGARFVSMPSGNRHQASGALDGLTTIRFALASTPTEEVKEAVTIALGAGAPIRTIRDHILSSC